MSIFLNEIPSINKALKLVNVKLLNKILKFLDVKYCSNKKLNIALYLYKIKIKLLSSGDDK